MFRAVGNCWLLALVEIMTSGHNNRCGTYLDILNAMPSYFPLDSKLTGDILTDVVKLIFHNYV